VQRKGRSKYDFLCRHKIVNVVFRSLQLGSLSGCRSVVNAVTDCIVQRM
jgi:hypothetical protein